MSKPNYKCVFGSLEFWEGNGREKIFWWLISNMQMVDLNWTQNCLLNSKLIKQENYTLLCIKESWRALVLWRDLQFGLSCYKIKPLKWSLPKFEIILTFQVTRHLELSIFRMKRLISKIGLLFSISLPRALRHCIQSSLPSHLRLLSSFII